MLVDERRLFKLYFLSSVFLIFSLVPFSVAWGHWSYHLDRCTGYDCGCVLYMQAYADGAGGGRSEYCQFITFAQIPLLLISIILTFYHGVRAYIKPRREARKNLWRGNPLLAGSRTRRKSTSERAQETLELEPPQTGGVAALLVTSFVVLAVLLTVFGFFMDGYFQSCKEYRRTVARYLGVSSRVASLLYNRLICTSIFDFMDYLQPARRRPGEFEYGRTDRINTGMSLLVTMVSLILSAAAWVGILLLNFRLLLARVRKPTT